VLFYRESEIKHGRIAMLAVLGMVVPEFVRLPGSIYQGVSVVDAHNAMVAQGPLVQLLFWLSLVEIVSLYTIKDMDKSDRKPGEFWGPLGGDKDVEGYKRLQVNEIKNGRLAMLAFGGMITQAVLTGHGFPFLY